MVYHGSKPLGSLLVLDHFKEMVCKQKHHCVIQAGACVGKAEYRELLAKAVLAAWHSAGAQDPEVLQLIISVCFQHRLYIAIL